MNKRALVIGSEVLGLHGVENDACAMKAALEKRGFTVDLRLGTQAKRAGFLEGLGALREQTEDGDAVVFYYGGHGAYTRSDDASDARRFQALVPTDWEETTRDDYRGISSWELSCLLKRLTDKTRNVVTILDCCHATQMSRGEIPLAPTIRALSRPSSTNFAEHNKALQAMYSEAPQIMQAGWSNPHMVRMVACGITESAHEMNNQQGICRGVFTEELIDVLDNAADESLSWELVAQTVRQRVTRKLPSQRPDIEGPLKRRLFSILEDNGEGITVISAAAARDRYRLQEGKLHGVSEGDVYSVMPPGSSKLEARSELARISVVIAQGTFSEAQIEEWRNGHNALPNGAVAIPIERAAPRRPVAVIAPEQQLPELERALAATHTLRVAGSEEREASLATLRLSGNELTVEDKRGPMFPAWTYPRGLQAAIAPLVDLSVGRGLKALEGSHGMLARKFTAELGVLLKGQCARIADRGAALGNRDRLFVKVKNELQQRVHVNVLNLGSRGSISLITPSAGLVLDPLMQFTLGQSEATDAFDGLELTWPNGLPTTGGPRLDEIIVVVTSKSINLQALQTPQPGIPTSAPRGVSQLRDLVAQLRDGVKRDISHVEPETFLVKALSFYLDPTEDSLAEEAAASFINPDEPPPTTSPS